MRASSLLQHIMNMNRTYLFRSKVLSSLYLFRISSKFDINCLNVSRSMTKHVTPSAESQMMLAVRKSSLQKSKKWSKFDQLAITYQKWNWFTHYVLCVWYSPLQRFLAKEIAFAQNANEFLFLWVRLANRYTYLSLWNDEESVTSSTLSHLFEKRQWIRNDSSICLAKRLSGSTDSYNVIALLVEGLFQYIGNFDQRVFGQILENGHTESKSKTIWKLRVNCTCGSAADSNWHRLFHIIRCWVSRFTNEYSSLELDKTNALPLYSTNWTLFEQHY